MKKTVTTTVSLLLFLLELARGVAVGVAEGKEHPSQEENQASWPHGGFLPFPQGLGPDGTRYKTDYHCEGQNMTVSCLEDENQTIEVVRGNFGRFSIAICNRHGETHWNVNCMAPETTQILKRRCDGRKECVVPVKSSLFPDACPGTMKYLEIHYKCEGPKNTQAAEKKLPPWLVKKPNGPGRPKWSVDDNSIEDVPDDTSSQDMSDFSKPFTTTPRRPILVTERTTERTTKKVVEIETQPEDEKEDKVEEDVNVAAGITKKTVETEEPILIESNDFKEVPTPKLNIPKQTPTPENWCPPTTARQLQWDWTQEGKEVVQPCPIGATGHARWSCGSSQINDQDKVQWSAGQPDMSDCKSLAMSNLESSVRKEDPENVLVSTLAYITRTKSLFGGDLETAVATMRTVASRIAFRIQQTSFHNKESHIKQVLQNVFRSANNMLEPSNFQAWMDLSTHTRLKVVSQLLLSLEENAFLLASVINNPDEILESSSILTMSIAVLDSRVFKNKEGMVSYLQFPPENNGNLLYVDDSVQISTRDLTDNSRNGIAEMIFFSYSNLHNLLSDAEFSVDNTLDTSKHVLNSRIVGASISRPGRHVQLYAPTEITLRHLSANMSEPICVFWDMELNLWSDSGCQVLQSNETETICQCQHLTNFAVLMRPLEASSFSLFFQNLASRMDVIGSVLAAIIFFVILLLVMKCRHKLGDYSRCCCCCIKSNEIRKSQSFYTGLSASSISKNGRIPLNSANSEIATLKNGLNGTANSRTLLLNNSLRAQSQYVLSTQNLPPGSSTMRVTPTNAPNLIGHALTKPRAHITLNPYSTQLVDNINMMMGNHSKTNSQGSDQVQSSEEQDLVYRSVSPHGHVYWEIDPSNIQSHNFTNTHHSQFAQHDPLASAAHLDENFSRNSSQQQNRFLGTSEQHPLLATRQPQPNQEPSFIRSSSSSLGFGDSSLNANGVGNSFVRTGVGRYNIRRQTLDRNKQQQQQQQQQQQSNNDGNSNNVLEQLQNQVQIRDIKPIQVSVKSSEYIEAKIRTLRKGCNNNCENKEQ